MTNSQVILVRPIVQLLKKLEILDSVAVRMTVLTGKSKYPIHPKHLLETGSSWYGRYLEKRDVVLDIGCSNGAHSIRAARLVKSVIAVDYDQKNLDVAKKLITDKKIKNISLSRVNVELGLKYPTNHFDKVLFLDVMEHLNNRSKVMHEIYRVLKKGGLLLYSVPNSGTDWKKIQKKAGLNYYSDPDHKTEYSDKQAIKSCTDAGLKVLSLRPITLDTPLAPVFSLIGAVSIGLYRFLGAWRKNQALKHPENSIGFIIVAKK